MAHTQINNTLFSGSEIDNFNEFELSITGAIGIAGNAASQQSKFLLLHLKGYALFNLTRGSEKRIHLS